MVSDETMGKLQRQRARRVAKAEQRSGFKEGQYTRDGLLVVVGVSFYLGEFWWVRPALGLREPLTPELWTKLVPYGKDK